MKCQLEIFGKILCGYSRGVNGLTSLSKIWRGNEMGKLLQDLRVPESNNIRARIEEVKKKGSSQFVVWGGR